MFNKFRSIISRKNDIHSLIMRGNPAYAMYDIGDWTYGEPKVLSWSEGATLKIGKYCSFAEGVTIMLGGEHRIDWITTYLFSALLKEGKQFKGHPRSKGDVIIGNDVWIGRKAMNLSGVTIGNGAVVEARSVVTKDFAPYAVVAGNPIKEIKRRFEERCIEQLQYIAWRDWPHHKVLECLPLLLSSS